MAYQVLARKYRSRTFEEVIGQEPIATTLVNAIQAGRIHHGYLFTGTRGSGKTSMARILAKALNCLSASGPTIKPCCTCDACIAIGEGQDLDVVEIDAASNTGVDNIRELRSNTAYRPARCRFKVYIIDEVHMLSTGAFNALLKTLEEPPEHVKFILATTEIQKVPATIQSRCQRFNFRNIGPEAIAKRLAEIAQREGATADAAALRRVARLANGSMRDALSLLDQLLSASPTELTPAILEELVPPPQNEQVFKLLGLAAAGDVAGVLQAADEVLSAGRGLEVFCADALDVAHALLLVRACGADSPNVDLPAGARDEYAQLAVRFELSQYVQMIALFEELRRNVRFSGAGRALTDAALVRLANLRNWAPIEQLVAGLAAGGAEEKKKSLGLSPAPPPVARSSSIGSPARAIEAPPVALPIPEQAVVSPGRAAAAAAPPAETVAAAGRVSDEAAPVPAYERWPEAQAEADDADDPDAPAPVRSAAPVRPTEYVPVSSAELARIRTDPLVQQTLDLFDGVIVHAERRVAQSPSDLAAE